LNRNFSESHNSTFKEKELLCIQQRNVISLIDLPSEEDQALKIKKHLRECKNCHDYFHDFQNKCLESKIYIPKPQIDSDTKVTFNNEVHELFKTFELNEKVLLKKKIKRKIQNIDNLASKPLLRAYAFGVVLFVILKKYFN